MPLQPRFKAHGNWPVKDDLCREPKNTPPDTFRRNAPSHLVNGSDPRHVFKGFEVVQPMPILELLRILIYRLLVRDSIARAARNHSRNFQDFRYSPDQPLQQKIAAQTDRQTAGGYKFRSWN
jgi:hypothetical protein